MEKENIENKELKPKKTSRRAKAPKKEVEAPKVNLPKLDPKKIYEFVGNGEGTLKRGLYKVTGEAALILIEKGYGKLKD